MAAAVLAVAAAVPFTPLAALFGLVPLPLPFYAALLATTACYLLLLEAVKRRFYRSAGPRKNPKHARNPRRA
jgi:Mg2+-importing ATPase